jgi:SAM-dependent methyltransferase
MDLPPQQRFAATADTYARFRPGYPEALVDWVLATTGLRSPALVLDVGCGTGLSTRAFAARGLDVVGVDPTEEMLEHARRAGGARYQRGESTATGLPPGSVTLVISGQAFHWFDVAATLAELRRILVPGGWCAAFWNVRAATPFLGEYEQLLHRYARDYERRPKALPTIEAIAARPEVCSVHRVELPNRQDLDREGLVGRAFSSSYVAHDVAEKAAFERELSALFDRHADAGRVAFLYRTVAIAWQLRP